ncbi:hypothetical protein ACN2CC_26460 [Mesorhizobium muleiense]|uniref:hypothetical protein n=1 Tax=Mesorhizobium muleiense TaxID=1004279 RepID=UPI003AFB09D6
MQRPLFFAGQLLTEDDLQLLSDYAATKGRMHNRFLHGAGVVCGLQVGCHPCGGGKVIVHSGAALDCCGNDIYVPCSVELDINKMVSELRIRNRGGYDCGDPCEEDCDDSPDDVNCLERKGRRYCLYVEYCEELEEPVTPYVSNGDCAVQVCKPTRIHEGYKFDLRCPVDEPEPDNILTRIHCCIGDLTSADKSASDVLAVDAYGRRYKQAAPMVKAGRIVEFVDADRQQIKAGIEALPQFADMQITESTVRRLLDQYQATAAAVIRYDLQSDETKEILRKTMPGLDKEVETARSAIQSTGDELKAQAGAHLSSARDRLVADLWVSQGTQWTDPKLPNEQKMSEQQLLYAYNAPSSAAQSRLFSKDLAQLRDWLIDRLEHKALFSDCRLRRDVMAIQLPNANANNDPKQVADASKKLVEALLRYLIDCICAALNPPCQPCHDDAVKLACLTFEDCDVVRICNLERTYVLSGPAMRYWLPFLHTIGEFFEKACCEFEVRLPEPKKRERHDDCNSQVEVIFARSQNYMATTAPAYRHVEERPQLAALLQIANIDPSKLRSAVNLAGDVGSLVMAGRDFTATGFELDLPAFGKHTKASLVDAMIKEPQLRETFMRPIESELAVVREMVEAVRASSETVAASLEGQVTSRVTEVNRSLEKRLADSEQAAKTTIKELRTVLQEQGKQVTSGMRDVNKSLEKRVANEEAAAKTVKELQTALREQQKRNDALERRLAKLETGGPS